MAFKKVAIIALGLLNGVNVPASVPVLAGGCELVGVDYNVFDLTLLFKQQLTDQEWNTAYSLQCSGILNEMECGLQKKFNSILDSQIQDILKNNFDLLSLSMLAGTQGWFAEQFLSKIRLKTNAKIIIGGTGVSVLKKDNQVSWGKYLLNLNLVDFYAIGDGELIWPEFLKDPTSSILGINNSSNIYESRSLQIDDLNNIPFQSYRKINLSAYKANELRSVITVTGSKGCVRNCSFCDVASIWPKFKFRSGGNIVNEIKKHFYETGVVEYKFTDSLINGSLKTFRDMNQELIKLKNTEPEAGDIRYTGQFIIRDKRTHPEEMYLEMSLAGARNLAIGVETGSDRVRNSMNKQFSNEDLYYHMDMCNKYNIGNTFLLFTGYPTETESDFNETLNLIKKYQKNLINESLIDISHPGTFMLMKGSPAYQELLEQGAIIDDDHLTLWSMPNSDSGFLDRLKRSLLLEKLAFELNYPAYYTKRLIPDSKLLELWENKHLNKETKEYVNSGLHTV